MADALQFRIGGMNCGHCVRAVTAAVHTVDPGAGVSIDLAAGTAAIVTSASPTAIADAIVAKGYEAAPA